MIRDTISKIEARLQGSNALSADARAELLSLLGELKREIENVEPSVGQNIAGQTESLTKQATEERNPELLKRSLDELAASVGGFETSHPALVQVVNRICTTLANIGI